MPDVRVITTPSTVFWGKLLTQALRDVGIDAKETRIHGLINDAQFKTNDILDSSVYLFCWSPAMNDNALAFDAAITTNSRKNTENSAIRAVFLCHTQDASPASGFKAIDVISLQAWWGASREADARAALAPLISIVAEALQNSLPYQECFHAITEPDMVARVRAISKVVALIQANSTSTLANRQNMETQCQRRVSDLVDALAPLASNEDAEFVYDALKLTVANNVTHLDLNAFYPAVSALDKPRTLRALSDLGSELNAKAARLLSRTPPQMIAWAFQGAEQSLGVADPHARVALEDRIIRYAQLVLPTYRGKVHEDLRPQVREIIEEIRRDRTEVPRAPLEWSTLRKALFGKSRTRLKSRHRTGSIPPSPRATRRCDGLCISAQSS